MTCNCENEPDSTCAYFGGRALTFASICEIGSKLELSLSINDAFTFGRAIIAAERKALGLPYAREDLVE